MQRTRTYECMCLLDNREVRKGWAQAKDGVAGLFTKHGAKILSARRWDECRLAYPIKGQQRGTYLLLYVASDTQALSGIRRDIQFNESILRSLIVDCETVPPEAYEPEAEFDVNAIPSDEAVVRESATRPGEADADAAEAPAKEGRAKAAPVGKGAAAKAEAAADGEPAGGDPAEGAAGDDAAGVKGEVKS